MPKMSPVHGGFSKESAKNHLMYFINDSNFDESLAFSFIVICLIIHAY